jgi:hypothetical protein
LKSVGPNVTLIEDDFEAAIRRLKAQLDGEIDVAGPNLAGSLTNLRLIDEYRLYFRPIVLGHGQPFFVGPRPSLRLVDSERIGEDVKRLTYVPANRATHPADCADSSGAFCVEPEFQAETPPGRNEEQNELDQRPPNRITPSNHPVGCVNSICIK